MAIRQALDKALGFFHFCLSLGSFARSDPIRPNSTERSVAFRYEPWCSDTNQSVDKVEEGLLPLIFVLFVLLFAATILTNLYLKAR